MFNLTWLTEVDWAYFLGMFATFAMASAQFRAQWSCPLRKPCARPRQGRDETGPNGIRDIHEHNRYHAALTLQCGSNRRGMREDSSG